jgi:hypothetical protein
MASVIPRIIRANLTDSMGARILLFCFFHLNLSKPPREAGASKTTALRYRLSSGARSAIDSLKLIRTASSCEGKRHQPALTIDFKSEVGGF